MRSRKTVEVDKVKEWANHYLASSTTDYSQRLGVASLLEVVLEQTGNYRGYRSLDGHQAVLAGTDDPSRRYYY